MANQTTEDRLRDSLQRYATELYQYRQLLNQSQNDYRDLMKLAVDLQNDNQTLAQGNMMLINRNAAKDTTINNLKIEIQNTRVENVRKDYSELRSRSQRKKRKDQYRKALNNTIRDFPDVIGASVRLNVGSEWLELLFSADDIDTPNGLATNNSVCDQIKNEHNYCQDTNLIDLTSNQNSPASYEDLDPIIVNGGKISQRHIRRTVHVVDKFKIPHELRMACQGILPSIHTLRKERLLMSSEKPYIQNPNVSTFNTN